MPQLLTLVTYAATTEVVRHWRWTAAQLVDGGALRELRNTLCKSHQRLWRRAAPVPSVLLTPWHVNYFVNFPPARGGGPSIVPTGLPCHFREHNQKSPSSLVGQCSWSVSFTSAILTVVLPFPFCQSRHLNSYWARRDENFFFTKRSRRTKRPLDKTRNSFRPFSHYLRFIFIESDVH